MKSIEVALFESQVLKYRHGWMHMKNMLPC